MSLLQDNQFGYCPRCAASNLQFGRRDLCCQDCGYVFYQNVATGVGAVIYRQSPQKAGGCEVLLTLRGQQPQQGYYDLPGGFIEPQEGLETALYRELREELGDSIGPKLGLLQYLYSAANDYPYQGNTYPVCDVFFLAQLLEDVPLVPADDVADCTWCVADEIPFDRIAFASASQALAEWLGK